MQRATILVPTDFSDYSRAAVELASCLARESHARLLILHVQELGIPSIGENTGVFDPEEMFLLKRLEQCVPLDPSVDVEHRVERGDPAEEILRTARRAHAQTIVIGRHGRSGLMDVLLGSVAKSVMQHATCPVILVQVHADRLDRVVAWSAEASLS